MGINNEGDCTVTGSTFTGNCYAIDNKGVCTVTGSTFTYNGNCAIGNEGDCTVTDSTFSGNYGNSDRITIMNIGVCTVTGCTFTVNNSIYGRVIINGGSAFINFNRIFGTGGSAIYNVNNGTVDANNNWWGSNNGPADSDINNESGTVNCYKWLVLTLTSPGVIITQANSLNIPVSLFINNHGEDTSSQGYVPNGIPINFTTTMGTINSTAFINNGIASSVLNFNTATGNITASLDNQTVSIVQSVFSSIQAAIDDTTTLNGDSILLAEGIYTENIVLNKSITLAPAYGNVTIQALNSSNPVITINSNGNGSVIMDLTIKGATNSYGIYLNGTSNCYIQSNNLTDNYNGISLLNSNNNTIQSNVLMGSQIGICLENSNNNTIQNNDIEDNYNGIYLDLSNEINIIENNLLNNTYGINSQYSSAVIQFNRITGNSTYGLLNQDNSTINAINNWWGSNDGPIVSADSGSDICNDGGTVDSHSWLELNVSVSTTNSGGNTSITADLTHNNEGNDTSSGGHVPNGIPINFTSTFGTFVSTSYTVKGKATTILNLGSTQNTTVTTIASLDNQTNSTTGSISTGSAVLTIKSTAIDNSTNLPLDITYTLPLNDPVTWLSVLWKKSSTYVDELQVIVNGTVVIDRYFTNNAYNTWKNSYPEKVFNAIQYVDMFVVNNYIYPNLGIDTNTYIDNSASVESFVQNGFLITKIVGNNHYFLVTDLETGLTRDVLHNVYGVYCFHDPLTQNAYELCEDIITQAKQVNWRRVAGITGILLGVIAVGGATASVFGTWGLDSPIALAVMAGGIMSIETCWNDLLLNWDEPWIYDNT